MATGYASLKKEHILPVFTEKRALFQHILRDAKSTRRAPLGKGYLHVCVCVVCVRARSPDLQIAPSSEQYVSKSNSNID